MIGKKVVHHMMMSEKDAHYVGGLVNGARIVVQWGDVGTELMVYADGDKQRDLHPQHGISTAEIRLITEGNDQIRFFPSDTHSEVPKPSHCPADPSLPFPLQLFHVDPGYRRRKLIFFFRSPQGYDLDLIAFLGKIICQKTGHSFCSAFSQAVNMKKNFSAAQSLSSLPLRHHISFIPLLEHKIRPHNTGIISAASSPSIPCFHIIS